MKKLNIILGALFSLVVFSGCLGGPTVVVEDVQGADHLGLSQGCYSTVSGQVKSSGSATAYDVTVTCSTTQGGAIVGTENKDIGHANTGSSIPFSMDVDTDCLGGEVQYACVVSCSNC